jgi:riboflavin biosynthesis pyrimidine reductase
VAQPSTITTLADRTRPLDDAALAEHYRPDHAGSPHLRANFVASVDGAVEVGGRTGELTSPPDQRVLALLRAQCDALLLGAGTLRAEGYGPVLVSERWRRWRRDRGMPEHPVLVIVSGSLALDPAWPVFSEARTRPLVATCASAPAGRRTALAAATDLLTVGEDAVDLPAALAALPARGLRQVLCEGGPHLLGSLIAADLVDELCLTISPLLAGAGAGRIAAGPASPLRSMRLGPVLVAGDHLLLRYHRARGGGG